MMEEGKEVRDCFSFDKEVRDCFSQEVNKMRGKTYLREEHSRGNSRCKGPCAVRRPL